MHYIFGPSSSTALNEAWLGQDLVVFNVRVRSVMVFGECKTTAVILQVEFVLLGRRNTDALIAQIKYTLPQARFHGRSLRDNRLATHASTSFDGVAS